MNGKKKKYGRKGLAAGVAMALFALFAVVSAAMAGSREDAPPERFLMEKLPNGGQVLLFEEYKGAVWLVYSGTDSAVILRLGETGEEELRRETAFPISWAAPRGERLFLRRDTESGAELICLDGETLETISQRNIEVDQKNLVLFCCDSFGTAYTVENGNRKTIRSLPAEGEGRELLFRDRVDFLEVDREDGLFVHAGTSLFMGARGEELKELVKMEKPAALLGPGRWIDGDGVVYRLGKQGAEALFRTEEMAYPSCFYCLDGENCLLLSLGSGTVRRYGENGSPKGFRMVGGTVRGLWGKGALLEKEDGLYYVSLSFPPGESPAPTVSAAPTLSPSPEPEPPAWVEGSFLIAPQGTTAAQARELLKPETADIRDARGNTVTWGRLCTGMTVNGWTVVVPGDCDGTGTVTGADVTRAAEMSLDNSLGEEPYRRAADLDQDGEIGPEDLLAISGAANGW